MDYSLDESPRKTTSAGYRFPSRRSEYHNKCVPAEQRQPAAAPPVQPTTKASDPKAAAKCDSVTLDEIWKESVHSEKRGAKDWYVLSAFHLNRCCILEECVCVTLGYTSAMM